MKHLIHSGFGLAIAASILAFSVYSQVTRTDGFVDANRGQPNSFVQEIPYVPDEYEGSFYQHDEWRVGNVELFEGCSLEQYPLKYDIEMERLEILADDKVKILEAHRIKSFEWKDPVDGSLTRFIHPSDLVFAGGPGHPGLYEVIIDGEEMQLLARRDILVKEGNYNLQLDIGDRTPKLIQRESYYLVKNGIALKAPGPKRERLLFFRGKRNQVEKYARKQNLNFRKRDDLIEIVAFYNNLP